MVGYLSRFPRQESDSGSWPSDFGVTPSAQNPALCPVTCLDTYLQRVQSLRRDNTQLFVSPITPRARTSPQLISTWICSVVRAAYNHSASAPPSASRDRATLDSPGAPSSSHEPSTSGTSRRRVRRIRRDPDTPERRRPTEGGARSQLPDDQLEHSHREGVAAGDCSEGDPSRRRGQDGEKDARSRKLNPVSSRPRAGTSSTSGGPVDQPPDLSRPAHELRAISASMALLRGTSLQEVLGAVGWSSASTFTQFYWRHLDRGVTELASRVQLPGQRRL